MPCDEGVTDAELAKRLDATASAGVARWLAIDALPRKGHTTDDRIDGPSSAACSPPRPHGAGRHLLAHPLDDQRGLVGRDGSPSGCFCRGELPP